jgi:Uri superfamily endonuclease
MPGTRRRGTYCLIISCKKDTVVTVGKLGKIKFMTGYYAYVGSALNSMDKRVKRHMERKKKIFWHIDHLTTHKDFKSCGAYIIENEKRMECRKASRIGKKLPDIPGFGSSDCNCESHLFYAGGEEDKLEKLKKILSREGFKQYGIYSFINKGHE